jgi:Skp family chaperone for outer membrane proteins
VESIKSLYLKSPFGQTEREMKNIIIILAAISIIASFFSLAYAEDVPQMLSTERAKRVVGKSAELAVAIERVLNEPNRIREEIRKAQEEIDREKKVVKEEALQVQKEAELLTQEAKKEAAVQPPKTETEQAIESGLSKLRNQEGWSEEKIRETAQFLIELGAPPIEVLNAVQGK